MPIVVAVDGPAGSGKSSICQAVANQLGFTYVNTGALYRAVGYLALQHGVSLDDSEGLVKLVGEQGKDITWNPESGHLHFAGEDISPKLHTEDVGKAASAVAKVAALRAALLPLQRKWAQSAPVGAIIDGRDIGTVVFPRADVKIFLTASLEQRAKRRLLQLGDEADAELAEIQDDLAKRDTQDSERASAPLKQADDAHLFDTSAMDFKQSVQALVAFIEAQIEL